METEVGKSGLTNRQALMILSALPHLGPVIVRRLQETIGGDASTILGLGEGELAELVGGKRARTIREWERRFDLAAEERKMTELGVRYAIPGDVEYPALLAKLIDAPLGLYQRGPLTVEAPAVAIVGTRHATRYGLKMTGEFVRGLVRAGFTIVSGLALGIDAEAHRVALEAGGKTVAVLGNGVDRLYPRENRELFAELLERGGIQSEFYLGRVADRQTFPQRNRIVSGMTVGTLVVESAARGGSLITARFAMEQNRTVFAVPGRLDQPSSRGCLDLIRDGATLTTSVDDILEELSFMQLDLPLQVEPDVPTETAVETREGRGPALSAEEEQVFAALLAGDRLHPDQICEHADLASFEVHAALMMLELQRRVARNRDGTYERL